MGIQFPPIAFLYLLYLFIYVFFVFFLIYLFILFYYFFFCYIIHIFVQWYKALLNLNLNSSRSLTSKMAAYSPSQRFLEKTPV